MEVNPWRSPIRPGGFCILYPYLSPVWYTSAWHRLSHSGLRRRVRVCARTPKPHSTHLLIHVRGKKWETATLSSVTAGNSPLSALCSLQWDWLLVSIILSPPLHNRHFLTSTHKHTIPHNFTISLSLSLYPHSFFHFCLQCLSDSLSWFDGLLFFLWGPSKSAALTLPERAGTAWKEAINSAVRKPIN